MEKRSEERSKRGSRLVWFEAAPSCAERVGLFPTAVEERLNVLKTRSPDVPMCRTQSFQSLAEPAMQLSEGNSGGLKLAGVRMTNAEQSKHACHLDMYDLYCAEDVEMVDEW